MNELLSERTPSAINAFFLIKSQTLSKNSDMIKRQVTLSVNVTGHDISLTVNVTGHETSLTVNVTCHDI